VNVNLWSSREHALDYIQQRADSIPHRKEGEAVLLEQLPQGVKRILDIGTGDGRILALVKKNYPLAEAVGLDFSPAMLELANYRFASDPSIKIVEHNLDNRLPKLGSFDVVTSCFAIHHVIHERKRSLYAEIYDLLVPGGVFCNLEHVASATEKLHVEFLAKLDVTPENEDPSNKLLDLETQLRWLREIGFRDVDCLWKWRELALLTGRKEA
jgi:tRNA (cmo5U34)-methyltransferase